MRCAAIALATQICTVVHSKFKGANGGGFRVAPAPWGGRVSDKTFCSYEQAEFESSDFDESGVHKHKEPAHYLTGDLKRTTRDGHAPLDVERRDA